jgi:hypothetical protein
VTNQQQIEQLGRAIRRAVEAHGADGNTFTVGELSSEYGAPSPLAAGRLLRHRRLAVEQSAGYRLIYVPGRPCRVRVTTSLASLLNATSPKEQVV